MICINTIEFTYTRHKKAQNGYISYGYIIYDDAKDDTNQTYCNTWKDMPISELEILAQVKRDAEKNPVTRQLLDIVIDNEDDMYINNKKIKWEEIKEELL